MDKSMIVQLMTGLVTVLFLFCASQPQHVNLLKINGAEKDSCYRLADSVSRKIEVLENTMQDTVLLGLAVLIPGYVGDFRYLGMDNRTDAILYPETPDHMMPKTSMICVHLYERRKTRGHLVLRFKK